jgi:hypothetical protein
MPKIFVIVHITTYKIITQRTVWRTQCVVGNDPWQPNVAQRSNERLMKVRRRSNKVKQMFDEKVGQQNNIQNSKAQDGRGRMARRQDTGWKFNERWTEVPIWTKVQRTKLERIVRWESNESQMNQGRSDGNVIACNVITAMALQLTTLLLSRRSCCSRATRTYSDGAVQRCWSS